MITTKVYVLKDPETNAIRYVGITTKSLEKRLKGHLRDVKNRPDLNYHKISWLKSLLKKNLSPQIEQIAIFDTIEEAKEYEIEYIAKYKIEYDLTNCTPGGDNMSLNAHSREAVLKSKHTRPVVQYNIYGEFIAEYPVTEDARRELKLQSASKLTMCARGKRDHAHGYIWRYKGDKVGDLSKINKDSLCFCNLNMYDLNGNFIKSFDSYLIASKYIGDNSKGGNIAAAATGKQLTCKGYLWKLEYKLERGVSLNSTNSANEKQNAEQGSKSVCND